MSLDAPYELSKSYDLFAGVAIGLENYRGVEQFFCGFNNTPAEGESGLGRFDDYVGVFMCATDYLDNLEIK